MTREQFDLLVRRVETQFAFRPAALWRRVILLVVLGYVGLLGGLASVLVLAALLLGAALFLPLADGIGLYLLGGVALLAGGAVLGRALWVRLPPPVGLAIHRAEAPALFAALDELQGRLRSLRFHQVLLVPDCNASVAQVPRLGVLGWPRNYLLLGLPLLEAMSPAEMRAVLAHECAHLSRQHGRAGHGVYRLRRSWETLLAQLARPRLAGEVSLRPLIAKFVNWYWPRFNAHAFVLSRAQEYEADAVAVGCAGAERLAEALLRTALLSRLLEDKFWPEWWQQANQLPEPPADVFEHLHDSIRAGLATQEQPAWIAHAYRQVSSNADTHPCLAARVQALRCPPPHALAPAPLSAAATWLGGHLPELRRRLGTTWASAVAADWRQRHAKATALAHRLERLDHGASLASVDTAKLWDKAALVLDLEGGKPALPLLRQILALEPEHAAANFHYGRLLLEDLQPEGVACLERAMAVDQESVPAACQLLEQHYRRCGDAERLRALAGRLDRFEQDHAAAQKERRTVTATDPLAPHGLASAALTALVTTLAAEPELALAHLAQKQLLHRPKQPLYLLCVSRRIAWHRLPNAARERALVGRLTAAVRLPGRVLILSPHGSYRQLARRIQAIAGAAVFRRGP